METRVLPHTHDFMSPLEKCPWSGTAISRAKFVEIQSRIREEERKRLVCLCGEWGSARETDKSCACGQVG